MEEADRSLRKIAFPLFLIIIFISPLALNTPSHFYFLYHTSPQSPPFTPVLLLTNSTKYVIIVGDSSWTEIVAPLADWKTRKGIPAEIYTVDWIYQHYEGVDNASKIRNFLKDLYTSTGIQWVLLLGDVDRIPIRYFTVGSSLIPSDYYYAALDGSFDNDNDGNYGEPGEIDWHPELYVGRVPVSSEGELNVFINKTLTYEQYLSLHADGWISNILLVGGEISRSLDIQGWRAKLAASKVIPATNVTLITYDSIRQYNNLTENSFVKQINEGAAIVNICSHGSSTQLYISGTGPAFFTPTTVNSISNGYRLPFFFISACSAGYVDWTSDSTAESLLKDGDGGAIAVVASTRTSFGGDTINDAADTFLDYAFFKNLFSAPPPFTCRPGYALYKAKEEYYMSYTNLVEGNSTYTQEFLEYILLGDPEIPLCLGTIKQLNVEIDGSLSPGHRVTLRVSDGASPVSGAYVCVQGWNYYRTYLTDENGEVLFPCPERGTYNITITKEGFSPAYTSINVGTPVKILVDEYHQQGQHHLEFWNDTLLLRSTLNASLFQFKTLDSQIKLDSLRNFDILVIYYPSMSYAPEEVEAIREFVRSGGGLLIIGENDPNLLGNVNEIASLFNVKIQPSTSSDTVNAQCIKSPLTYKVNRVTLSGSGIVSGGSPILVTAQGEVASSYTVFGHGRVVFISDLDLWKNSLVGENDNLQLFKSMCEWLAKQSTPPDFNITVQSPVKKGEKINVTVTVDHPYGIESLTVIILNNQEAITNTTLGGTTCFQLDTMNIKGEIKFYVIALTGNGKTYTSDVLSIRVSESRLPVNLPLVISSESWQLPLTVTVITILLILFTLSHYSSRRSPQPPPFRQ